MGKLEVLAEGVKYTDQLDRELNRFSEEQRKIIYDNLYAIELNEGCSNGCDFCGLNSIRGVRSAIPYPILECIAEEITRLTDRIPRSKNESGWAYKSNFLSLYDATDPLDYEYEGHNYFDVLNVFLENGFEVPTSTAIPVGKEELAIANLEDIRQISISHMNRERIKPYFEELGIAVYIDLFNYSVFKGYHRWSERSAEKIDIRVDGTVEETINELLEVDNSLPKEARFYDLRIDGNKPRHEVQTGKILFLLCADKDFCSDSTYRKVSDRDYHTVQNVGRAFYLEPYENLPFALGSNGVKITPKGVFNVFSIPPSKGNTAGKIIEKITPDRFNVVELEHAPHFRSHDRMEWHYVV